MLYVHLITCSLGKRKSGIFCSHGVKISTLLVRELRTCRLAYRQKRFGEHAASIFNSVQVHIVLLSEKQISFHITLKNQIIRNAIGIYPTAQ